MGPIFVTGSTRNDPNARIHIRKTSSLVQLQMSACLQNPVVLLSSQQLATVFHRRRRVQVSNKQVR